MYEIKSNYIDQAELLQTIGPYNVYCTYAGTKLPIARAISSPFRKDKNPSFALYYASSGDLMFKDYSTGDSGNCVRFVAILFDINYYEALIKIRDEFTTSSFSKAQRTNYQAPPKEEKLLELKKQEFTAVDAAYWSKYGITREILNRYYVISCKHIFINKTIVASYAADNPIYAYIFKKDKEITFKIYQPFNKKMKWLSNCDKSVLQGWDQMPPKGDLLVITKSLKDVMVLHSMGYSSLAVQSENPDTIKPNVYKQLEERFSRIVTLFDNDPAGINASQFFTKEYSTEGIFLPGPHKDISDSVEGIGFNQSVSLLKTLVYENA